MMACTVRSVRPTATAMSRIRARVLPAISTSTCPCPVSIVQLPWLHGSSWAPWQELLAEAGYKSSAPGWPTAPEAAGRLPHCLRGP